MESLILRAYFSDDSMKKHSHYHDCHQIVFITEGQAEFCVNEAKYTAKAGNLLLFSRYENHSVTIQSKKYNRYVLHINPATDASQNKIYSIFSNRPVGFENIFDLSDSAADYQWIFNRITQEFSSHTIMGEEMLQLLLDQLLIMLSRRLPEGVFTFDDGIFATVSQIQQRFEKEYFKQYTLEDLARQYSISTSTLSHKFKSITGTSVMDYLQSCRIVTAKKLLTKTTMNIGEIVESCGFSDNSNFSRTFKNLCGMSPTSFRDKYRH